MLEQVCDVCEGDGWVPIAADEVGQPVPCPVCTSDAMIESAREAERARIVAWLREWADGNERALGRFGVHRTLRKAADRIEGGEHG
jgi:hypothetical protein